MVVIERILRELTEVLVIQQDHFNGVEDAAHHVTVEQYHVDDLPDDGDLVEPVILAADIEQHLLQVHRIVYPNGYRQAQKRCYLFVGQREGQEHQQPDAQIYQPSRFAKVPGDVRRVKRISQQESQQHSSVEPVRSCHELLE